MKNRRVPKHHVFEKVREGVLIYQYIRHDKYAAVEAERDELRREVKRLKQNVKDEDGCIARREQFITQLEGERDQLLSAIAEFRSAFVIAVGDQSPFAKIALGKIDGAILAGKPPAVGEKEA